MSNARWFYARGQQQTGPVSFDELKQLVGSGQLAPQDMIWAEGTPSWVPAGTQAGLFGSGPATSAGAIGYFEPAAGLPPRAAATLRGHARPMGDVGDWPLDDARMAQFREALALRKKVTGAAGLYRLLLLLAIIFAVFALFGVLFATGSRAGRVPGAAAMGMGLSLAFITGLCLLYYFAWRGTMRSQRWAPLTMFIVFIAIAALNIISSALQSSTAPGPDAAAMTTLTVFVVALAGIFAFISWRSFAAIPKYLAQPGWCQELIVSAGL